MRSKIPSTITGASGIHLPLLSTENSGGMIASLMGDVNGFLSTIFSSWYLRFSQKMHINSLVFRQHSELLDIRNFLQMEAVKI